MYITRRCFLLRITLIFLSLSNRYILSLPWYLVKFINRSTVLPSYILVSNIILRHTFARRLLNSFNDVSRCKDSIVPHPLCFGSNEFQAASSSIFQLVCKPYLVFLWQKISREGKVRIPNSWTIYFLSFRETLVAFKRKCSYARDAAV